ncbi:MAG: galactose-1-phosphate uridylyltransferase [Jiangellaceae bacterium]
MTTTAGPHVTRTTLADGRALHYFDDGPGRTRRTTDGRGLPAPPDPAELRHDPLHDDWVVVAAHRQGRTHLPSSTDCPLCPSVPGRPTEVPARDYDVVVFDNRFPSLPAAGPGGDAAGTCEVICFSADHETTFADLDDRRLATIGQAWVDRTVELSRLPGVEQVFLFENRGDEIGATLRHPHGQIYAYPFVPARMQRALSVAATRRDAGLTCAACDLVERAGTGERLVWSSAEFVAVVPAAARWPYEVQIFARRHVPDLVELSADELASMTDGLRDVLSRFGGLFGSPVPYVAACHQAPVRRDRDLAHLRFEVFTPRREKGKLKYLAASESAAGAWINDVSPEEAAARLRAVLP